MQHSPRNKITCFRSPTVKCRFTLQLVDITLCILGHISCVLSSVDFFKIIFFEKFFQEYHQSVKQFGSRSDNCSVWPDLGQNCLQRLSTDDISRQEFK